jgi:hypothetical protein
VSHWKHTTSLLYIFTPLTPGVYSRGWVDPVPDPLLLRKSGSAENRTRNLWIWSKELWTLDHRGGHRRYICFIKVKYENIRVTVIPVLPLWLHCAKYYSYSIYRGLLTMPAWAAVNAFTYLTTPKLQLSAVSSQAWPKPTLSLLYFLVLIQYHVQLNLHGSGLLLCPAQFVNPIALAIYPPHVPLLYCYELYLSSRARVLRTVAQQLPSFLAPLFRLLGIKSQ